MANEVLPAQVVKDLLSNNWSTSSVPLGTATVFYGNAAYLYGQYTTPPKPQLILRNDPQSTDDTGRMRFNLEDGDAFVIYMAPGGEQEELMGYGLAWRRIRHRVQVDLFTMVSRQRLYDLMRETRRILFAKRKATQYQLVRYQDFSEITDDTYNNWQGIIHCSLESDGVGLFEEYAL